jgi:hypothetical protein
MPAMLQQNLPVLPLERLESGGERPLQKLDVDEELPLSVARDVVAGMLQRAFKRSLHGLKDFGDPSQIARQLKCIENQNLPALFAKPRMRYELAIGLAEVTPGFTVHTLVVAPRGHR